MGRYRGKEEEGGESEMGTDRLSETKNRKSKLLREKRIWEGGDASCLINKVYWQYLKKKGWIRSNVIIEQLRRLIKKITLRMSRQRLNILSKHFRSRRTAPTKTVSSQSVSQCPRRKTGPSCCSTSHHTQLRETPFVVVAGLYDSGRKVGRVERWWQQ